MTKEFYDIVLGTCAWSNKPRPKDLWPQHGTAHGSIYLRAKIQLSESSGPRDFSKFVILCSVLAPRARWPMVQSIYLSKLGIEIKWFVCVCVCVCFNLVRSSEGQLRRVKPQTSFSSLALQQSNIWLSAVSKRQKSEINKYTGDHLSETGNSFKIIKVKTSKK